MPAENPRYPERDRERNDLILTPRQFAWGKDLTKGYLTVYVGPYKLTVSEMTEQLVVPSPDDGQLQSVNDLLGAVQQYTDVTEGEYAVLTNPAENGLHPEAEKANKVAVLNIGRQVNLPGPLSFSLWPFQTVKVIKGHQLQMNQYVIVRVLNEDEAIKNWDKAIVKPQTTTGSDPSKPEGAAGATAQAKKSVPRPENLSVGQLLIIKGTEVSFYIPPTGLEVVADEREQYVREAVTLEQLEYCVLVDQSGDKRFEKGPKVVFPKPSETFKEAEEGGVKHRKFRAIELTKISGLHIKVTAPYKEGDREYRVGEELFINGEDQPIYFPRAEHAIIGYDGRQIHYATAVPKGEGRYVLNRFDGNVALVAGPKMLLPDPRTEVIVRRILSEKQVKLWYPDNVEAMRVNRDLAAHAVKKGTADYLAEPMEMDEALVSSSSVTECRYAASAPARLVGEEMGRKTAYTPPRTVTLNTKYEGAVSVDVWTGYAVLVVDRSGERKVVEGPQTILLEFDQSLAYMALSTGKPKNTDVLKETAYLRVLNNLVSDIISVETVDSVQAKVKVSYRVNFTGDKEKWFDVENYVKLLCDHARSMIRNMVKKVGIQEFNARYIDMIRDTILGQPEGADGEKKKRRGLSFSENGMVVFDVEVLGLEIGNSQIASLLVEAQHEAVRDTLQIAQNRRELEITKEREAINRETDEVTTETALKRSGLEQKKIMADLEVVMARMRSQTLQASEELKVRQEQEKTVDTVHSASLCRKKLSAEQELVNKRAEIALELEKLSAESKELAERTKSVTPELIAALQAFGDKATVQKMAEAMAPMALLGGKSVAEILGNLLKGSGMEGLLSGVAGGLTARMALPEGNGRQ
ncbi:MAG: hypothetical protein WC648_02830 [Candidatus Paceibacterota bacterium]|jgi:major vault protein